jgi:serine/threonine protein phosphatase 1
MVFKRLFARTEPEPQVFALPAGERVYAIGDIHGRRDCLDQLLLAIDDDEKSRPAANTTVVFLGDLVDRGLDSKGVIERVRQVSNARKCILLMGNHEEILIRAWEGDRQSAGLLHRVGGRETLMSYGVTSAEYDACDLGDLAALVGERVPPADISFLRGFIDQWQLGDYLFVHAGIRPGIAFEEQRPSDLRWIRREFLEDDRDHGAMVIHGHSITEDVDERANRIGIDTGAFASGKLTALGIEGTGRWIIAT